MVKRLDGIGLRGSKAWTLDRRVRGRPQQGLARAIALPGSPESKGSIHVAIPALRHGRIGQIARFEGGFIRAGQFPAHRLRKRQLALLIHARGRGFGACFHRARWFMNADILGANGGIARAHGLG